jgi:hypothetical protein
LKTQSWTKNNKNNSNAFSFNQGTYIKNPKYKSIVKKNLNDPHQNEDMNKVKKIQIYAHISGVKNKEYLILANWTSKEK